MTRYQGGINLIHSARDEDHCLLPKSSVFIVYNKCDESFFQINSITSSSQFYVFYVVLSNQSLKNPVEYCVNAPRMIFLGTPNVLD